MTVITSPAHAVHSYTNTNTNTSISGSKAKAQNQLAVGAWLLPYHERSSAKGRQSINPHRTTSTQANRHHHYDVSRVSEKKRESTQFENIRLADGVGCISA